MRPDHPECSPNPLPDKETSGFLRPRHDFRPPRSPDSSREILCEPAAFSENHVLSIPNPHPSRAVRHVRLPEPSFARCQALREEPRGRSHHIGGLWCPFCAPRCRCHLFRSSFLAARCLYELPRSSKKPSRFWSKPPVSAFRNVGLRRGRGVEPCGVPFPVPCLSRSALCCFVTTTTTTTT